MSPTEIFVARTNIARMRVQIATECDGAIKAAYERLLQAQIEILRVGEADEASPAHPRSEKL